MSTRDIAKQYISKRTHCYVTATYNKTTSNKMLTSTRFLVDEANTTGYDNEYVHTTEQL